MPSTEGTSTTSFRRYVTVTADRLGTEVVAGGFWPMTLPMSAGFVATPPTCASQVRSAASTVWHAASTIAPASGPGTVVGPQ
jgi:hypothetical protein